MKTVVTFTEKERDKLAIDILTDAIIFERIATGMHLIKSAGHPNNQEWAPESQYNSVTNALPLFGFKTPKTVEAEKQQLPITDVLRKIFYNTIKEDDLREPERRSKASEVARDIMEEWKGFLSALELKKVG